MKAIQVSDFGGPEVLQLLVGNGHLPPAASWPPAPAAFLHPPS